MGIPNPILYFPSNDSLDHKSPISCFGPILFFLDFEIRWGFQIRYCTFPQMTNWTTKVQFLLISWTSFLWMLSFLFLYYLSFFSFLVFSQTLCYLWMLSSLFVLIYVKPYVTIYAIIHDLKKHMRYEVLG